MTGAGGKAFVSGADISEFKEKRATEEAAAEYSKISEAARNALAGHAEADDRDDPRLLHRRRARHRIRLRHPHRRRGLALRHPGREARARLCL